MQSIEMNSWKLHERMFLPSEDSAGSTVSKRLRGKINQESRSESFLTRISEDCLATRRPFRENPSGKFIFFSFCRVIGFSTSFLRESSRHYQVLASALYASFAICARLLRLHFQFERKIRRDYNFKLNEGASLVEDVIATCYPCLRSLERDSVPFDVLIETDLHELRTGKRLFHLESASKSFCDGKLPALQFPPLSSFILVFECKIKFKNFSTQLNRFAAILRDCLEVNDASKWFGECVD